MQIIPKKRYSKHKLPGYYYFHTSTRNFIIRENSVSCFDGLNQEWGMFRTRLNTLRHIIQDRIGIEIHFCTAYKFNSEEDLNSYLGKRKLVDKLCQ